jgi:hypothetical protein
MAPLADLLVVPGTFAHDALTGLPTLNDLGPADKVPAYGLRLYLLSAVSIFRNGMVNRLTRRTC